MSLDPIVMLNTIRANSSPSFKERIPEATATNLAEYGAGILEYEAEGNEFISALVNRIGLVILNTRIAHNPLAPLKKGMLGIGKTVEQVHIDLIKAQVYDPRDAENTLFKRNIPDVYTIFHTVNSENFYPLSISNEELRKAFVSYDALDKFVSGLIEQLYSSATQDEFLMMKELINDYGTKGYFQPITVPEIVDKASAEEAMVQIKATSDKLTFMSQKFNSAGVWNLTPKEDQYLITTPEINARLDVSVLAMAFNMDKAKFSGHIIVVDDLGGLEKQGVQAIMVDRDWYQVYDTIRTFKSAYNGKGLYWNYFYHVWMIYSTSRFFNAVAFVKGTPTVTNFEVSPATATLRKGQAVQLVTSVDGTNNPSSKATYAIEGNTDSETVVTPLGKVILGSKEEGPTITCTATSVADTSKTDTCVITVSA